LIDPYEPNDYRAIVSDDWERYEKRRIKMIKRQGTTFTPYHRTPRA
jgi:hypothetical protein